MSYSTLPVRGEFLDVLNLTVKPNSITLEFTCPSGSDGLVVEVRYQYEACQEALCRLI
jgi:hypothetical protein